MNSADRIYKRRVDETRKIGQESKNATFSRELGKIRLTEKRFVI